MPASQDRIVARQAVSRVRERSAFAHETVESLLAKRGADRTARAFITRLAYGTVACRGTVDAAIGRFLANDVKLEPVVSDCLALSAYELLYMRTPARAAVNEGVELVKAVSPRAGSLANAVLRRLAADAPSFPWGDPAVDDEALARLHGHPDWLAAHFIAELGRDRAAALMAADNEPAPLYLAPLGFRRSIDEIVASLEEDGAEPVVLERLGAIECRVAHAGVASRAIADGDAIVVDAAAQFAASCVPMAERGIVLDIGAGRGSKSLILAARSHALHLDSRVIAIDLHRFKLDALDTLAAHVGAPAIESRAGDATDADSLGLPRGTADAVLIDAPCSGLGTLRRHPDRRWRARPNELDSLATLGARLLSGAASLVKPGGFVVYSTCTIARRENDEVIDGFLASEEGAAFRLDPLGSGDAPGEWHRFFTTDGRFLSVPDIGGPDGHFATRLVREY